MLSFAAVVSDYKYRGVAQFGRAPRSGRGSRRFKSCHLDHVHCFVSIPLSFFITQIVKYLKGISKNRLLMEFSELRKSLWKGHLWNENYFIETIGFTCDGNTLKHIDCQQIYRVKTFHINIVYTLQRNSVNSSQSSSVVVGLYGIK